MKRKKRIWKILKRRRKRPNNKIPDLRKKMIYAFNRFIRLRDKDLRCISCGVGGPQQAGHYWPTSQFPEPAMRFNEKNVNGQCIRCNIFLEGNRQGYRSGLIQKYGPDILDQLDSIRTLKSNPWTTFEYLTMIEYYTKKGDELWSKWMQSKKG